MSEAQALFAVLRQSADADCVAAFFYADCCGTGAWTGVNVAAADAFLGNEAACAPLRPECDCASRPTFADDGTIASTSSSPVAVRCVVGICTTHFFGTR